jgi:Holliday junction resolvase
MGRASRRKGAEGELEVVKLAKAHGFTAARTRSGGGQALSDIAGIPGFAVESKRTEVESVRKWFEQAADNCGNDIPVVAHRKNKTPWLATLELDELLALIARAER